MKITDIKQSDLPIRVRLTEGFSLDESYDIGMIIQINNFQKEDFYDTGGWCYEVYTTVHSDDVDFNKSISKPDWFDKDGNPTLNWFEVNSNKKQSDGSYTDTIYVMEEDDFCELIEETPKENIIEYRTEEMEVISKSELRTMKKFLGEFTLKTNSAVEIHSSEMENGKWNGIKIEQL